MILSSISTLLGHNLKQLHDEFIDLGVEKWSEWETEFNNNFTLYFKKTINLYENVPTVLSDKKMPLRKIYQETYLEYKDKEGKEQKVLTTSLEQLLTINANSWITGFGGIGKSTMLKNFLLSSLQDGEFFENKIPIYIELRKYNMENKSEMRRNFIKFIYHEMCFLGFDIEFKYFEFMAKKGRFVFLLDAFDEISSEYFDIAIHEINELMCKYEKNNYIVTSRNMPEIGYLETIPQLEKFKTTGLNKEQAISLISKIDIYSIEINEEFQKILNETLFTSFESMASNPILLLLMFRTFQKTTEFPKIKAQFLLKVYDILYEEHDAIKLGKYVRDFRTSFSDSELLNLFSRICSLTYFKYKGEKKEFTKYEMAEIIQKSLLKSKDVSPDDILYDLSVCLCVMYQEGDNWYFVHNIFQEFYAAYYIYEVLDKEKREIYFKKIILSENNNWRTLSTTLEYFEELDKTLDKVKLIKEVIIPILDEIEKNPTFTNYQVELDLDYFYDINVDNNNVICRSVPSIRTRSGENKKRFLSFIIRKFTRPVNVSRYSLNDEELEQFISEIKKIKFYSKHMEERIAEFRKGNKDLRVKLKHQEVEELEILNKIFLKSSLKSRIDQLEGLSEKLKKELKIKDEQEDLLLEDLLFE